MGMLRACTGVTEMACSTIKSSCAESLFRTCQYRPDYSGKPFGSLEKAQVWTQKLVRWYQQDHKHSGLKFVMPAQRHSGQATAIPEQREHV
jgi:putative transposase